MNNTNGRVESGDFVEVRAQGTTRQGEVVTAEYFWRDQTYGLQIDDPEHGVVYWKQWEDGGEIIRHRKGG
jgi:hypothetical protein